MSFPVITRNTPSELGELTLKEIRKSPEYEAEFVLVNDYSKDNTWNVLCRLAEKYPFVKAINLAKNFGQHNALMAAFHYADGDLIVGMDDDMQTHPSQLPILLEKMKQREHPIPVIICSSQNYRSPDALGTVWYNKLRDIEFDFKEILENTNWDQFQS